MKEEERCLLCRRKEREFLCEKVPSGRCFKKLQARSCDKGHPLCLALIKSQCQLLAEKCHHHRKSRENRTFQETDM